MICLQLGAQHLALRDHNYLNWYQKLHARRHSIELSARKFRIQRPKRRPSGRLITTECWHCLAVPVVHTGIMHVALPCVMSFHVIGSTGNETDMHGVMFVIVSNETNMYLQSDIAN